MKPVVLKFGEYLPDRDPLDVGGMTEAKNVLPVSGQYTEVRALATTSDALTGRCQGAFAASDEDGTTVIYAGSATKLESLSGTAWTDRSGATYTLQSADYWKFAQYGDRLMATSYKDAVQSISVGGAAFADLAAAAPKGRHIAVIRDFVFLGDLDVSGTAYPYRVQWSAIADPTDWPTPGSQDAADKQAGQENLPAEYGPVVHISDGEEFGLVFQQRGVTRFTYVGGEAVFHVDTFERSRGMYGPQSAVKIGRTVYYMGYDDFYATDGATVTPLGYGKFAKTFFTDFDQFYPERVTVSFDPQNKLIFWGYPSGDSSAGSPDTIAVFNYIEGRWAYIEQAHQMLFPSKAQAYTLEQLDAISASLDDLPASLDSTIWMGGRPLIGAFYTDHKLGSFTGDPLDATLDTEEAALNTGGRAIVQGVRPQVSGSGTVTVKVGYRDSLADSVTYTAAGSLNSRTRMANFRAEGRYHRVRLDITGGFSKAQGVEILATTGGMV